MNTKTDLILYHKPECPLCEEFELELRKWLVVHPGADYRMQDIEEKESLKRKYEWRVPVLTADEREICFAKFNQQALESFMLSKARPA